MFIKKLLARLLALRPKSLAEFCNLIKQEGQNQKVSIEWGVDVSPILTPWGILMMATWFEDRIYRFVINISSKGEKQSIVYRKVVFKIKTGWNWRYKDDAEGQELLQKLSLKAKEMEQEIRRCLPLAEIQMAQKKEGLQHLEEEQVC